MQYPNLFKRIIPFMLALTLGISLAIVFGGFRSRFAYGPGRMFHLMREINEDNFRLQRENEDLKQQLEDMRNDRNCGVHFGHHNLLHTEEVPALDDIPDKSIEKKVKEHIEKLEKRRIESEKIK